MIVRVRLNLVLTCSVLGLSTLAFGCTDGGSGRAGEPTQIGSPTPSAAEGTLRGYAYTGGIQRVPWANRVVRIEDVNGSVIGTVTTGPDGGYTTQLPGGVYRLVAVTEPGTANCPHADVTVHTRTTTVADIPDPCSD